MGWTAIASSLAKIFAGLVGIFHNKQLIDAGVDKANAARSRLENDRLRRAMRARVAGADGMRDPFDKANN